MSTRSCIFTGPAGQTIVGVLLMFLGRGLEDTDEPVELLFLISRVTRGLGKHPDPHLAELKVTGIVQFGRHPADLAWIDTPEIRGLNLHLHGGHDRGPEVSLFCRGGAPG